MARLLWDCVDFARRDSSHRCLKTILGIRPLCHNKTATCVNPVRTSLRGPDPVGRVAFVHGGGLAGVERPTCGDKFKTNLISRRVLERGLDGGWVFACSPMCVFRGSCCVAVVGDSGQRLVLQRLRPPAPQFGSSCSPIPSLVSQTIFAFDFFVGTISFISNWLGLFHPCGQAVQG